MDKRDPYSDLGETLGELVARHENATANESPRGTRRRPRFRSEELRARLTFDVDMEPSVGEVLRRLAMNPPARYGPGEIRPGDLAVAALITGLLSFRHGQVDVVADWTARSRGKRSLTLGSELDDLWDTLVQALEIERWPG